MNDVRQIKQLQTQLDNIITDYSSLKIEISNKQKELSNKQNLINSLRDKIKNLKNTKTIRVSEHAMLRYFERVKGFNISEIQEEIITKELVNMVETLGGNGVYPVNDFKLKMKDFTIITIVKD